MRHAAFVACLTATAWTAVFGLVELARGVGVMEVVALELAALVLAVVAIALLVDDVLGPRA